MFIYREYGIKRKLFIKKSNSKCLNEPYLLGNNILSNKKIKKKKLNLCCIVLKLIKKKIKINSFTEIFNNFFNSMAFMFHRKLSHNFFF